MKRLKLRFTDIGVQETVNYVLYTYCYIVYKAALNLSDKDSVLLVVMDIFNIFQGSLCWEQHSLETKIPPHHGYYTMTSF